MNFNPSDLAAVAPETALMATAVIVLLAELLVTRKAVVLQGIVVIGLLATAVVAIAFAGAPGGAFSGMVARDGFTLFLKVLITGVALLTVLISKEYFGTEAPPPTPPSIEGGETEHDPSIKGGEAGFRHGEYYALLLMTTVGMMTLAAASDLITFFIGLETMSVGLYLLAGLRHEKARSGEAALKYLLLGAFASGFLLYGMALIYGATGGKTNFNDIALAISTLKATTGLAGSVIPPLGQAGTPVLPGLSGQPGMAVLLAGVALVMVGLLFKVAAVPFHFWSPDVYQGSPTPVTAFMSAGPKAAAFAVAIRLFGWALPDLSAAWGPALWVVAALTMTVGNVIAISQKDIKRMLAYSSISHAGYLLLAVLAAGSMDTRAAAASGLLFYLAAYYLMNLGAFTIAICVSRGREGGDYQIDDYQGLAAKQPWVALGMTIFMVSLAGIPPTAGFFGKLFVFSAAVKAGYIGLVVIAVLNSVVSAYYYLRIVVFMYMKPQTVTLKARLAPGAAIAVLTCAIGIIVFGVAPGMIRNLADRGAAQVATPVAPVVAPIVAPVVDVLGGEMMNVAVK